MEFNTNAKVGPYTAVSKDQTRYFMGKQGYRFVLYGAYNAFGLIGTEMNGIAVLDEENKRVLCDGIAQADTGYFGPTTDQVDTFIDLLSMDYAQFKDFINSNPRSRYRI